MLFRSYAFPWIRLAGGDAASAAEGLFMGIARKMADGFKTVRRAELELDDRYNPQEHDGFFQSFGLDDFSKEELELCPPVLVIGDDIDLERTGFEGLSGLLSSRLPIKIAIIDTMDFGVHDGASGFAARKAPQAASRENSAPGSASSESASPPGDGDHHRGALADGFRPSRKETGLLALIHRRAFVLQSSIGNPGHLMKGVMEGLAAKGPALFRIHAPDPGIQGIASSAAYEQARLAIEGRAFPLFKYDPGIPGNFAERLDLSGNPDRDRDWAVRVQETKTPGGGSALAHTVTAADWAAREGRFARHFRPVPKNRWHGNMTAVEEYAKLTAEERAGLTPYLTVLGADGAPGRLALSAEMAALVEDRLNLWRFLRELVSPAASADAPADEERAALEKELGELREKAAEYEATIARLEQEHGQVYHERLTRNLLSFCGDAGDLASTLREFVRGRGGHVDEGGGPDA